MSTKERLPPIVVQVLGEILDQLQVAEDEAKAGIQGDDAPASFPFVAGYMSAIVKTQAARLERLIEAYAPADTKDGA